MNGFTDRLYTQPETISNYSSIANLHTLQITRAPAKPFPACCVFTSRSLATAPNSTTARAELSSTVNSTITPLLLSFPFRTQLTGCPNYLFYLICTDWVENTVSNSNFVVMEACLPRRCIETAVLLLLRACMFQALPNNGCCLWSHCLATRL
jgi:hypothetical protein